jgi:hypothetical protein
MQGAVTAHGTNVDLTTAAYDTQGECLFAGFSWSNHTTKGGTAVEATTDPVNSTIATPITQVRTGCLSCHNNTTQYNSMSGRWKSDYLKTGHKNMLRKVTPGIDWAGADGVVFTQAAVPTGATAGDYQILDFVNGEATTTFWGTRPLMYLFGDWMAPAPDGLDTIVWRADLSGARYNGTSTYSCAACHATGWSNPTAGVCAPDSTKTTKVLCEGVGSVWYPSSGEQSDSTGAYLGTYAPVQPGASWTGNSVGIVVNGDNSIAGITGRWDHDGINCNRCHKVAYDPTFPINDEGVNAPQGFTTHETDIFDGWKCVNTCFGCHQSIAKTSSGTSTTNDLNPVKLQTKDGDSGPGYKGEFNSHPIGNSFLNSPHAKFTGTIVPNKVGKYDLAGGTFASTFRGKLCRSSTAVGGGSILESTATGGIISGLADCNRANGKTVGDVTSYGYWQDEAGDNQVQNLGGSCITCHNVHESLFDPGATEPLRRECTTCHAPSSPNNLYTAPTVNLSFMNHPRGNLTPFENEGTNPSSPCEVCHMPKATDGGFPIHLWRVNSSASYSTFPTAAEFTGNTKKIANTAADGAYTDAVWVDVDLSCGQCHGGGTNSTDNPPSSGVYWRSKADLAVRAAGIHNAAVDLVMLSVSGPTSAKWGTTFLVYDATKNRLGGGAGASTTAVYLSTDTILDGGDTLVGSRAVPALGGGAVNGGSISVTIPAGAGTVNRYLIWKTDNGSVVTEAVETNNTKYKAIQIRP